MSLTYIAHTITEDCPELMDYFLLYYSHHSLLYLADGSTLTSESGVTQGDVVGGVLFGLGMTRMLRKACEGLSVGHMEYHDDLVIFGEAGAVAEAIVNLGLE